MKALYYPYRILLLTMFSFYLGCIITFLFMSVEDGLPDDPTRKTEFAKLSDNTENKIIVVTILSSPSNSDKRKTIRDTWLAMHLKNNVIKRSHVVEIKYYFVIGGKYLNKTITRNIQVENEKHKDILMLQSLRDEYKQLAKKVVLSLKWVVENILNVEYVLKCDDDSFVRIDLLLEELIKIKENRFDPKYVQPQNPIVQNSRHQSYIYWGYFNGNARIQPSGRWSDTDWFLCDRYLPYALGGGYVLSINIVKNIVANINVLRFYNSEDVSVGAWTAGFDINRIHDKRFDTQWTSRGCQEYHLIRHKQSIKDMRTAYANLLSSNFTKMCKEEKLLRNPYAYNWNALPSQCCVP